MRVVVSGVPRGYQTPRPNGNWLQEAKELGLNLSGASEWGIKKRLAALRALNGIDDLEAD